MPPPNLAMLNVDLTRIENAEVRRTIRQLIQQLQEIIAHQQLQIEALVEMTVDKHVWSMSEYRHYLQKLSQSSAMRPDRMHPHPPHPREQTPPAHPAVEPDSYDEPERQVYRL